MVLVDVHLHKHLIELTQYIFRYELVPDDMAVGEFVMMHKGKGGADDMAQYRAVCLEEVGLKLVASIMLARLSMEVGEARSKMTREGSGKGKDSSSQDGLCHPDRTQGRKIPSDNSGGVPERTVN